MFCGQNVVEKTKEHVIPRWLIEMTGDPRRQMDIGPLFSNFNGNKVLIDKQISFSSFTFPACKNCNELFSKLEQKTKFIVEKLLENSPLSAFDFDVLLNWFDKVRIGLWLGYLLYLNENIWQIDPHFFISSRLAKADRALLIYKSAQEFNGIRFVGINTPAFLHMPSCFTMSINNCFLLNISSQFLLAKSAGLPYLLEMEIIDDGSIRGKLQPGTGRIEQPIFDLPYEPKCSIIGQAIFTQDIDPIKSIDLTEVQYYQEHLLEVGRTRPILQRGNEISWYSINPTRDWIPLEEHCLNGLIKKNYIQTLKIQNQLIQRFQIAKEVSKERANFMIEKFAKIIETNNLLISYILQDEYS